MQRITVAGLYFLQFTTYSLGPKPTALETGHDPAAGLFRRLDSLTPREPVPLKPGTLVVGIYGDNFFKRVGARQQADASWQQAQRMVQGCRWLRQGCAA